MTHKYRTIESFSEIGKLASTHGLDGFINFKYNLKGKQPLKGIKYLFLELKNESYIPFKIKEIKYFVDGEGVILFSETKSVEDAKKLTGKKIYLPYDEYIKIQPPEVSMNFSGFTLYNQYDKKVGEIIEVFESPGQLLGNVKLTNNEESLIPIVENWIINIDIKRKEITLNLPEGLIEIN